MIVTKIWFSFLFFLLFGGYSKGQEICFEEGECTDSLVLNEFQDVGDSQSCLDMCRDNPDCEYFTHYGDDDTCMTLGNCVNLSCDICSNCYSGARSCEDLQCWKQGICTGSSIGQVDNMGKNDCLQACQDNENCLWFSHDSNTGVCQHYEDCQTLDTSCATCSSGQNLCAEYEGNTKLIVIGGFNYNSNTMLFLNTTEVFNLDNPSSICEPIANYLEEGGGMAVGIIDGLIKACGGNDDIDNCYDYDPSTDSWSSSTSLLHAREDPRASFIDDVWLVSGDFLEGQRTTEVWTGSKFEPGPILPEGMDQHCQLTVNSSHVFFINIPPWGSSYLYDWHSNTWTKLPTYSTDQYSPSCGIITHPENGLEAIVLGDYVTEIFNFESMSWRVGPDAPDVYSAGFTQIGDTFVVVGGNNDDSVDRDDIFLFDPLNYEFVKLTQSLKIGRDNYPGVVVVPDEFVSCS